jgi:hypothetical protein
MGKIRFRYLNPYSFSRLGMSERNSDGSLSWCAEHGILVVKTHLLTGTDSLAGATFQRVHMAEWGGGLHRHPFEHILWLLQKALDGGVAVNPVTQWHRLLLLSVP